jgi:hypothetical protein
MSPASPNDEVAVVARSRSRRATVGKWVVSVSCRSILRHGLLLRAAGSSAVALGEAGENERHRLSASLDSLDLFGRMD